MSTLVLGSYVHAHCLQLPALPNAGQSLLAESYWSEHGGKGLNVGVGLQRLGAETTLLLPVGNDSAGRQIAADLSAMGFDSRWVVACAEQSGYGMGLISNDGDNVIAVFPGANASLPPAIVIEAVRHSRPARIYAQLEISPATVQEAFAAARNLGIGTVLNPSPWQAKSSALLPLTDVLVVNESEASLLFAGDVPGTVEEWLDALPTLADTIQWQGDWLIVTLGDRGCVALGRSELIHHEAWPVDACDATGAGDAFNAGLLSALDDELPPDQVLAIANACGAYLAGRRGVLPHLPDRAALDEFMRRRTKPQCRRIKQAS